MTRVPMDAPDGEAGEPAYRLPTGKEIRSMTRMEMEQHLRLAVREIHHLRSEVERLQYKLGFAERGFDQEHPPLEAEMVRIPLVEGKLR